MNVADYDRDGEIGYAEFARILTVDDITQYKKVCEAGTPPAPGPSPNQPLAQATHQPLAQHVAGLPALPGRGGRRRHRHLMGPPTPRVTPH